MLPPEASSSVGQAVMGAELTAGQGPAPLAAMTLCAEEEVLSVSLQEKRINGEVRFWRDGGLGKKNSAKGQLLCLIFKVTC